jgi:hypothetical protein
MSTTLAAGIALGGVTIAGLGAASVYALEKKQPTVKSIMRDFIIGSILFVFIMQLLPDSSQSVILFLTNLIPTSIPQVPEFDDLEIEVGIRKF